MHTLVYPGTVLCALGVLARVLLIETLLGNMFGSAPESEQIDEFSNMQALRLCVWRQSAVNAILGPKMTLASEAIGLDGH